MINRWSELKSYLREEFVAHLPFTLIGVTAGVFFVTVAMLLGGGSRFGEAEFHWAHITHIFFSAAAGAAIFQTYRDSVFKAVPVAALSSILLCTLSDVLVPYAGLELSGYEGELHFCAHEHPWRVLFAAAAGIAMGLAGARFFAHCNRAFHLLHILISTAASTLYLMMLLPTVGPKEIAVVGVTLFFALVIPCIAGDVALPLLFVRIRPDRSHASVHHHGHSHDAPPKTD